MTELSGPKHWYFIAGALNGFIVGVTLGNVGLWLTGVLVLSLLVVPYWAAVRPPKDGPYLPFEILPPKKH